MQNRKTGAPDDFSHTVAPGPVLRPNGGGHKARGMANETCGTCGAPAAFFKRDKSRILYACGPHAGFDWRSLAALDGDLHEIQKDAAETRKDILGDD